MRCRIRDHEVAELYEQQKEVLCAPFSQTSSAVKRVVLLQREEEKAAGFSAPCLGRRVVLCARDPRRQWTNGHSLRATTVLLTTTSRERRVWKGTTWESSSAVIAARLTQAGGSLGFSRQLQGVSHSVVGSFALALKKPVSDICPLGCSCTPSDLSLWALLRFARSSASRIW